MKGIKVNTPLLLLLLSLAAAVSSAAVTFKEVRGDDDNQCVYTIYTRTGSIWKGGTDSIIGVALAGSDGWGVLISDLESWGGLMGSGHDYFERGNLDIFSGRGPCLTSTPCWMNLTSDGSGSGHGWYCNYVEVTVTGPHMGCAQQTFTVEQWLATDTKPYELYSTVDYCSPEDDTSARHDGQGKRIRDGVSGSLGGQPRALLRTMI